MRDKTGSDDPLAGMIAASRWLVVLGLFATVATAQSLPDLNSGSAGLDGRGQSALVGDTGERRLLASADEGIEATDLPDSPVSIQAGSGSGEAPRLKGRVVVSDEGSHGAGRWGTDSYSPGAAGISGDTLTATVSFGGGCETHEFTLVLSDAFMMMDPVRLKATLAHDANGDPCEAWLTEVVEFDLTAAKKAHGEGGGTMILMLSFADGTGLDLPYEF